MFESIDRQLNTMNMRSKLNSCLSKIIKYIDTAKKVGVNSWEKEKEKRKELSEELRKIFVKVVDSYRKYRDKSYSAKFFNDDLKKKIKEKNADMKDMIDLLGNPNGSGEKSRFWKDHGGKWTSLFTSGIMKKFAKVHKGLCDIEDARESKSDNDDDDKGDGLVGRIGRFFNTKIMWWRLDGCLSNILKFSDNIRKEDVEKLFKIFKEAVDAYDKLSKASQRKSYSGKFFNKDFRKIVYKGFESYGGDVDLALKDLLGKLGNPVDRKKERSMFWDNDGGWTSLFTSGVMKKIKEIYRIVNKKKLKNGQE